MAERLYRGDSGEPKSESAKRVLPLGLFVERYRQHRPAEATAEQYVFESQGEPMDDRAILRNVIRPAPKRLEEGATTFEAMEQAGHS